MSCLRDVQTISQSPHILPMPSLTPLTTGGVLNPLKNTTNTSHNELLHQEPLQPPLEPRVRSATRRSTRGLTPTPRRPSSSTAYACPRAGGYARNPSKRPQTTHCWDATDRLKRPDIADRKIPGNWERNLIIEACRYFCLSYVRPWPVKLLRTSLAYRSRPAMERDMNLLACIGSYIGVCCCATTVVSQHLAD